MSQYRRYRWLVIGTVLVVVVFGLARLYRTPFTDPFIVALLAVALLAALVVQVAFTPRWDARSTGVFYTILGAAVFAIVTVINTWQPLSISAMDTSQDAIWATWVVGPILMLVGTGIYLWEWCRCRNDDNCDWDQRRDPPT